MYLLYITIDVVYINDVIVKTLEKITEARQVVGQLALIEKTHLRFWLAFKQLARVFQTTILSCLNR